MRRPFLVSRRPFLQRRQPFLVARRLPLAHRRPLPPRRPPFPMQRKPLLAQRPPFLAYRRPFLAYRPPFLIQSPLFLAQSVPQPHRTAAPRCHSLSCLCRHSSSADERVLALGNLPLTRLLRGRGALVRGIHREDRWHHTPWLAPTT